MNRVGCDVTFEVTASAAIVFQVATTARAEEELWVTRDGVALAVEEFAAPHGGRRHVMHSEPGTLTVAYTAAVELEGPPRPVSQPDRFDALLPSRYVPADRLTGFAQRQFGPEPTAKAVRDYVHTRLDYVAATSGPSTDAVDTLLSGQGVCRDFAHLMAALCRALNIPARVASVYAPGLAPMDFHLVVETAAPDGSWQVWDATGLAPRHSLVRIATGRDAADVAFATVTEGAADLADLRITAVVDGDLPADDHTGVAVLF